MSNYFKDVFSLDLSATCDWLPANQFLFQLANLFLVLTYFVKPNGLAGLIQLRASLTCAGLCFGLWGGTVICSLDCMLWNVAFAVGNAFHLIYLLAKARPLPFKSANHEVIYKSVFEPVGVKRYQYRQLMRTANQRFLQAGEYYARQSFTESKHIAILAHGQFDVFLNGQPIGLIDNREFVDSPEWLSMSDGIPLKSQVSIVAAEDSTIYQWHRKDLMSLFKSDVILKNIFDSVIGKDICKKFYSLHRTFLMQDNSKVSEQLKQASLFAYSAANLLDSHRVGATYPSIRQWTPRTIGKTQYIADHINTDVAYQTFGTDTWRLRSRSATTLELSSSQKLNHHNNGDSDDEDLSVSVNLSNHQMSSSKSSSLYKEDDYEDFELYHSLDRQQLINVRETDV